MLHAFNIVLNNMLTRLLGASLPVFKIKITFTTHLYLFQVKFTVWRYNLISLLGRI